MHTGAIPVCSMDIFDDGLQYFRMGSLVALREDFPMLSHPHKNNFYTILFSENWSGSIAIDSTQVNPSGIATVIIKPGCINAIHTDACTTGTVVCFTEDFFSLRYNSNVLRQFELFQRKSEPFFRLTPGSVKKINSIFSLLGEEYSAEAVSLNALRSYLNILLLELDRAYCPIQNTRPRNISQDKVEAFEKLVEQNFKEQKMPSSYAELLNVSPNYLNKLCKRETGMTAGDIIRKQIIIEAQRLLHYTRLTVGEISIKLGFDSTSYFVTTFKKYTSLTPEQFRKSQAF